MHSDPDILQAVLESIDHWLRMIAWVKQQPGNRDVQSWYWDRKEQMEKAIDESWFGQHCPLCTLCSIEMDGKELCQDCPLCPEDKPQGCAGPKEPWRAVCNARSWNEWLIAAEVMLERLMSIRDEYAKKEENHEDQNQD